MKRSLFSELKRRNVIRAAALYPAPCGRSAQGIAQLAPVVGAAGLGRPLVPRRGAIGFPFWIAFAWFYEFTPEGLKRESEIDPADSIAHRTGKKLDRWIFAIMGVAIVLLLTNTFVLAPRRHGQAAIRRVGPSRSRCCRSPNESNGQGPGLFFRRHLRGPAEPAGQGPAVAGHRAHLVVLLQGQGHRHSRRSRAGCTWRTCWKARCARRGTRCGSRRSWSTPRTDTQLWSQSYDRQLDDIFAIQDEIAARRGQGAEGHAARRGADSAHDRSAGLRVPPAGEAARTAVHRRGVRASPTRCTARCWRSIRVTRRRGAGWR